MVRPIDGPAGWNLIGAGIASAMLGFAAWAAGGTGASSPAVPSAFPATLPALLAMGLALLAAATGRSRRAAGLALVALALAWLPALLPAHFGLPLSGGRPSVAWTMTQAGVTLCVMGMLGAVATRRARGSHSLAQAAVRMASRTAVAVAGLGVASGLAVSTHAAAAGIVLARGLATVCFGLALLRGVAQPVPAPRAPVRLSAAITTHRRPTDASRTATGAPEHRTDAAVCDLAVTLEEAVALLARQHADLAGRVHVIAEPHAPAVDARARLVGAFVVGAVARAPRVWPDLDCVFVETLTGRWRNGGDSAPIGLDRRRQVELVVTVASRAGETTNERRARDWLVARDGHGPCVEELLIATAPARWQMSVSPDDVGLTVAWPEAPRSG